MIDDFEQVRDGDGRVVAVVDFDSDGSCTVHVPDGGGWVLHGSYSDRDVALAWLGVQP